MNTRNRIHNCTNPYQGKAKKVLCVCSAGLLRSPTAANVLHREFGYNTRSAGVSSDYALVQVDEVLLSWADEVVCMESWQAQEVLGMIEELDIEQQVIALNVPDRFEFMNEELQAIIKEQYLEQ